MSKAFVRESDSNDGEEVLRPLPVLPTGARNYLTTEGAKRLQDELTQLLETDRPRFAADPTDPDNRRQLQVIDHRIRHLQQSLASAEILAPGVRTHQDAARFGDTVTVREADGTTVKYRIVGVDEAGLEVHWISWQSPLAKALLAARRGEHVSFETPAGPTQLEVLDITSA